MTQPTVQHRQDIHRRVCSSYGVVSDILWREAMDLRQPVGTCTACGGLMRPMEPERIGPEPREGETDRRRVAYPARCAGCGREVEGQGPRVQKQTSTTEGK